MSIWETRDDLNAHIAGGVNPEGEPYRLWQKDIMRELASHDDFEKMSKQERIAFYQERHAAHLEQVGSASKTAVYETPDWTPGSGLKMLGWLLLGGGGFAVLISAMMSTSVSAFEGGYPSPVLNLGLLQNQLMVFQGGLTAMIGGIIFHAASRICVEISKVMATTSDA